MIAAPSALAPDLAAGLRRLRLAAMRTSPPGCWELNCPPAGTAVALAQLS
jgi:hypothetical protein